MIQFTLFIDLKKNLKVHNYVNAMRRSQNQSIGYAMYYFIMNNHWFFYFSFIKSNSTIYFGLLTVVTMFTVLIADLILYQTIGDIQTF